MTNIWSRQYRRAWLWAALAAFFGFSCAAGPGATKGSDADSEVRVEVQWRVDLATDRGLEIDAREFGQPVLTPGGHLVVGASNGWLYRIYPHSGEIGWATEIGGSIDAPALVAGGKAYVGTDRGELVAVDWSSGVESWRFETRGSIESRPTVEGGRAFVTDSEDRLYAVDATTGQLLWDFQHRTPEFFTIKGGGVPLVDGEVVYCGFATGELTALYADNGDEIWTVDLGPETGEFGDIDLPLIDDGDRIIAASHAGGIYAVEKQTGALLWHVPRGDIGDMEEKSGWLFAVTTDGRALAIDTREGDIAWEYRFPEDRSAVGVRVVGPFLAVATARGPMYWLKLEDGRPTARWAPSTGFQHAPVFDETQGYVMSNQGYLYGFGLAF